VVTGVDFAHAVCAGSVVEVATELVTVHSAQRPHTLHASIIQMLHRMCDLTVCHLPSLEGQALRCSGVHDKAQASEIVLHKHCVHRTVAVHL
jgi:hypothetical protein